MRLPRTLILVSIVAAFAFSLLGCEVSSESTTTVTTEVTSEDGTTETTTTTETTRIGSDGATTETTAETTAILQVGDWPTGWMGVSDRDCTVFYAESPDTGEQAFLVIKDPSMEQLVATIGNMARAENGDYVLTDMANGSYFVFGIDSQDEESATLDLGAEYGTVVLKPMPMDDLIDELAAIDADGQVLSQ